MASATVGILRVLLTANTAEFTSALKSATAAADAWSKNMQSIGRQATQLGQSLTKVLTLPLLGIAAGSAKLAMDFESSFAGVRKTVDATEGEFQQMSQAFRDLAKTIPINVNELNRLGEAAGALGIPKKEIVSFSKTMALLGVTTNVTSDQAAESIAKIQNIFGAAGKDTDRFASTLVALGNDGASTESQILEMATRIAGAGNAIGLTQGQVLGFASALSSVGIEAEMGGSAISRVFIDIAANVSKGGTKLDEFARVAKMTTEDFSKRFKTDAAGAVNAFISGLGEIKRSGGDLLGTLESLGFSEIRVRDTLLRTAGAGELLTRALNLQQKAWRDNTALTEEARKRFETTESQLKLLWNRVQDVGITLGNAFLPAIKSASAALSGVLPVIDGMAKAFAALPGPIQLVVVGFTAVLAAAGPALIVFGQLAQAASYAAGAFGKKGIATRTLGSDLGGLTGAATKTTQSVEGLSTISRIAANSLGLLGKAASVVGVAFAAWEIGRLIADLTGLDQKIADTVSGINTLRPGRAAAASGQGETAVRAQLIRLEEQRTNALRLGDAAQVAYLAHQIEILKNDQTRLAILDTISLAIKRGAAATITYAEAVKFNQDWLAKQKQAHVEATATATKHAAALSHLAELNAKYAADLKKIGTIGFREIQTAHDKYGESIKDLASKYGVAESSVERFLNSQKAVAKELKAEEAPLQRFVIGAKQLEAQLLAGEKAGLPMTIMLEEFGNKIEDVTHKAPLFGQAVAAATQRAADAIAKNNVQKLLIEQAQDAEERFAKWQKESIKQMREDQRDRTKSFLENLDEQQKAAHDFLKLLNKDAADSLEDRLAIIHAEMDERRASLNTTASNYRDTLAQIDQLEALAAQQATDEWEQHVSDVKKQLNTFGNIFRDALQGIPGIIQAALTGGNVGNAFGSLLSNLGGALGGKLFGNLTASLSKGIVGLFGTGQITQLLGKLIPGIGSILGSIAGPLLGKVFGHFFGTAGRDAIKDFAQSVTGSTDLNVLHTFLQEKLGADAEQFWIRLTQGVGRNNPAEARAAIDAVNQALEEHSRKQQDAGAAAEATATIQTHAVERVQNAIKELDGQISSLNQSIANEAPEEEMGIIEANTRAQIASLEDQRAAATAVLEELSRDAAMSLEDVAKAIDKLPDSIALSIKVALGISTAGEAPEPVSTGGFVTASGIQRFAKGGIAKSVIRYATAASLVGSFGTDTVPARLTPGELVLNAAQQKNLAATILESRAGSMPQSTRDPLQSITILQVDKRELARTVVDVFPGEARRLGVRVRS